MTRTCTPCGDRLERILRLIGRERANNPDAYTVGVLDAIEKIARDEVSGPESEDNDDLESQDQLRP